MQGVRWWEGLPRQVFTSHARIRASSSLVTGRQGEAQERVTEIPPRMALACRFCMGTVGNLAGMKGRRVTPDSPRAINGARVVPASAPESDDP